MIISPVYIRSLERRAFYHFYIGLASLTSSRSWSPSIHFLQSGINRSLSIADPLRSCVRMNILLLASGILCLTMTWAVFTSAPKNYTSVTTAWPSTPPCAVTSATPRTAICGARWADDSPTSRAALTLAYQTAVLPGRPPKVDPLYVYPAALSCHCARCDTASSDCIHKVQDFTRANVSDCSLKYIHHLWLHPQQSMRHSHPGSN
ncbi:thyrotropin subunit beta-like [Arapaima gigas]